MLSDTATAGVASSGATREDVAPKVVRYYIDQEGGYITLEIGGRQHRFEIQRSPTGRGWLIGYNGLLLPLSGLRDLLEGTELEPHAKRISALIKSKINEALTRPRHKYLVVKEVRIGGETLAIMLRDDGKIALKRGDKFRVVDPQSVMDVIYEEFLSLDEERPEIVENIAEALNALASKTIAAGEVVVVTDGVARLMLTPAEVVADRLIYALPFAASYRKDQETRRGVVALVVVSDAAGNVERIEIMENPVALNAAGHQIVKDYLEKIDAASDLSGLLPSQSLATRIFNMLRGGVSPTWREAYSRVSQFIDKYAYIEGRDKRLATLYAIAQVFAWILPTFPILRIIGEKGSGKRNLSRAIASLSAKHFEVVDPSEASLYTMADLTSPTVVIDETKITQDAALLLNAGYERGRFVPRVAVTEGGRRVILTFHVYGPKILVTRPGKLDLPDDTQSRIIEVKIERVKDRVFPEDVDRAEAEELAAYLQVLLIKRWGELLSAYRAIREAAVGVDPRTRDTYLPLLTVAYLVSKELGDPALFKEALEDMWEAAVERAGIGYFETRIIAAILRRVLSSVSLSGDAVRVISVSVKEIVEEMGYKGDRSAYIRVGLFLRDAPFARRDRTEKGVWYYVDLVRLNEFVKKYDVDLVSSLGADIDSLERKTGMEWAAQSSKEEWIRQVVEKLWR